MQELKGFNSRLGEPEEQVREQMGQSHGAHPDREANTREIFKK